LSRWGRSAWLAAPVERFQPEPVSGRARLSPLELPAADQAVGRPAHLSSNGYGRVNAALCRAVSPRLKLGVGGGNCEVRLNANLRLKTAEAEPKRRMRPGEANRFRAV
jgi:hypothetical protein